MRRSFGQMASIARNYGNESQMIMPGSYHATRSATLRVFDSNSLQYDGGNYTGFNAASKSVMEGEGDFAAVTISTYVDVELRESFSGLDLIAEYATGVNVPIHIGFLTTLSYDQVEIRFDTSQGVTQFDVFYAVMEGFCQGELPECNVPTTLNRPAFPAVVDYALTGMDSTSVGNMLHPERAVSLSMTDYASFNFANNIEGNIFLAIREQLTDYNPGTFIGFDIRNTNVGILNLMSHITIETYLNGILQESATGNDLLIAASMDSDANRYTVGVGTTLAADV